MINANLQPLDKKAFTSLNVEFLRMTIIDDSHPFFKKRLLITPNWKNQKTLKPIPLELEQRYTRRRPSTRLPDPLPFVATEALTLTSTSFRDGFETLVLFDIFYPHLFRNVLLIS